jgi:endo-1,4-beta-xylanase
MKSNQLLPKVARKVIFGATAILLVAASFPFTGCKKETTSQPRVAGTRTTGFDGSDPTARTGTNGGFFWSLYQEGGSANITFPNGGGNFQITYSGVNDVVGGKGWATGASRNIGYNVGSLSGSYNFVGIYGWTTNPLIEYYVAEKGNVSGGTSFGSVSSDGHSYSCTKFQRVNAPSIIGTATFWQYKDNWGGAPTGQNRVVTMANHINNWRSRGGQGFGSHNYQILALEAFSNKSGSINATVWQQ